MNSVWFKEFGNFSKIGMWVSVKGERKYFDCGEKLYCWIRVDEGKKGGKELREKLMKCSSGYEVKKLSYENKGLWRDDWDEIKVEVMKYVVRMKFKCNWELMNGLMLEVGSREVVEMNKHGDKFWGKVNEGGKWVGENWLVRVIMVVWSEMSRERETW